MVNAYLILANIVMLFHLLLVLPTIIIGPIILAFYNKRINWFEFTMFSAGIITALSFISTGECFLTYWEQSLRTMAGGPSFTGGFVSHYLGKIGIIIEDMTTTVTLTTLIILGTLRITWLWLNDFAESRRNKKIISKHKKKNQ